MMSFYPFSFCLCNLPHTGRQTDRWTDRHSLYLAYAETCRGKNMVLPNWSRVVKLSHHSCNAAFFHHHSSCFDHPSQWSINVRKMYFDCNNGTFLEHEKPPLRSLWAESCTLHVCSSILCICTYVCIYVYVYCMYSKYFCSFSLQIHITANN